MAPDPRDEDFEDDVTTQTRPRGRPRAGDPAEVSRLALTLIAAQGWNATTMEQIARESGVSAPTLFRYFPTKASVLWYGMDESARLFREHFDRLHDPKRALVEVICEAYLAMLGSVPVGLDLVKARVAVITTDADAAAATWPIFDGWRGLVTDFVGETRCEPIDAPHTRMLGAVIWSGLWAGLTSWSVGDEADPSPYVRALTAYVTAEALGL